MLNFFSLPSGATAVESRAGLRKFLAPLSVAFLLIPAFLLAGCGKDSGNMMEPVSETEELAPGAEKETEPESPWVGRWLLVITQETTDFHPLLVQMAEMQGQRGIAQIDRAPMEEFSEWKLASAEFQPDDKITLGIDTGGMKLNFHGQMRDGEILGCIVPEEQPIPVLARLEKTAETSLRNFETPTAAQGSDAFEKAVRSEPVEESLKKFLADNPNSPLVLDAYEVLLAKKVSDKAPLEQVEQLTTQMIAAATRWGTPLLPGVWLQVIGQLNFEADYRPLIAQALEELKNQLGENPPEMLKIRLDRYQGQFLLTSTDPEEQKQGIEQLNALLVRQPFEVNAILALARYYEKNAQKELALGLFAKLAILPGINQMFSSMTDPATGEKSSIQEKIRSLFTGDEAALQKYLDEVYEKSLFNFGAKRPAELALAENRRVPILELFTGAMCPPCVAGDLAVGGLERLFPAPEVIAVRYHQHIPGPDPLTNSAGEARFSFYGGGGTPTLFINGRKWDSVGGYLVHAQPHFSSLQPHVTNLLSQISPIKIQLDATLEQDSLKIHALASSLSKDRPSVKLRLLLVEPVIHFSASNGIRIHEMVVRDMPGGAAGMPAQQGTAELNVTLSVSKLKEKLQKELAEFEKNRSYEFQEIPLQLSQLQVVAIVQDDDTKEILQSAISPLLTPGEPATQPAAEAKAEEKPAEKPAPAAEVKPATETPAAKPAEKPAETPTEKTEPQPAETPANPTPAAEPPATPPAQESPAGTE